MKIEVFEKLFSFAVFFKLNQKNLNKTRAKRAPDIWARKFKYYSEISEYLNFRAKMTVSAIFKHSVSFKVCKKVSQTRKGFLLHFKSFCMDFKGVKGEERTKKREPKRNLKSAARERVRPRQSRKRHQSLSCNSVTSNPYAFLFLLRSFVPLLGWLL